MELIFEKRNPNCQVKPKVTIGICVRNCAAFVRETIKSIAQQDFPHELIEIIIVDDGSEDETLSIVLKLVSKMDTRIKVFHSQWIGLGAARNVIVKNACGDYILWVDGDMVLPKDHVSKQVEFMDANPAIGIAKAQHGIIQGETLVGFLENIPFMVLDTKPGILNSKLPGTGGAIYRLKAIKQVGGFDDQLKGTGEDQDAAFRVRTAGWLINQSPSIFYERRAKTWWNLFKKYLWYGYGDYKLYRKNRNIFSISKMNPIAGFIAGALYIPDGYRLTHCKRIFLLPFHFSFKMLAWCLGFIKASLKSTFLFHNA